MMLELRRDLRYAVRMLRKSPAFTVTAVLTLGLCIGANTAIFSVVDAVLLRPLPYPEPDRLASIVVFFHAKGREGSQESQTGRTWEIVRDNATFLERAVFGGRAGVNFAAEGKAEYVSQHRVSAGFFGVLGVNPIIGREFTPEEDRPGGPPVALLSHGLWKRAFSNDPSVIGRAITLRGEPHTVVGVIPQGFQMGERADVWTPLRPSTAGEGRGGNYHIVVRLRPGVSWAQAQAQIESVGEAVVKQMRLPPDVSARLRLEPFQRGMTQYVRRPLLILWAAVGLVLLIGCINIASLLLARAAGRTREIATRMALGGGRGAVVRQLLTESAVLAGCGGAAGVAIGWLSLRGLSAIAQESLGIWQAVRLDARVLALTMALSLLTSVLFGLFPALDASRIDLRPALAESGGRGVTGPRRRWPRRLLIVGEVALGVVLLVGAGLLIRTFVFLRDLRPGFDARNVITANLSLQDARYRSSARILRLFEESLARIRGLPGVESAAVGLNLPYERALNWNVRRLDGPHVDGKTELTTLVYVTPDYFRALRIPLRRGRTFDNRDRAGSMPVAIVNQAFAKKYLPEQDPIGSHLGFSIGEAAYFGQSCEIIGVVGDVQQRPSWGGYGPLGAVPAAYIPAAQVSDKFVQLVHTWFSPSWVVRASGPQRGLTAGMRRAVETTDPQLPFAAFRTIDDLQSRSLAQQRMQATLLGTLAGLALVLAAVGIYGLIANSVAERTRELGIRIALGATPARAMRTVALPGVLLALAGAALGCILARFAVHVLEGLVWGVRPTDPATFAAVALLLLAVAAAASFIPALRIARLNPAETLRQE